MEIGGEILADTQWSLAESPYVVTSTLTLASGVSLTIEPGVEVRFQSGMQMMVYGTLSAAGSETQNILFTSDNSFPSQGDWNGIQFKTGSSDSLLKWCVFEYAVTPVTVYAYYRESVAPTFENCTMRLNSQHGVYVSSTSRGCANAYAGPVIDNCIIESNGYCGIYYLADGHNSIGCQPPNASQGKIGGKIRYSTVRSNGECGIKLHTRAGVSRTSGEIYTEVGGNIIYENNSDGVEVSGSTNNHPSITNNVVYNNLKSGIYFNAYVSSVFRMSVSNNTVVENSETGIYLGGDSLESIILSNNIMVGNGEYGLFLAPEETLYARENNNIWSNVAGDYMNATLGAGDISASPLFVDPAAADFHLLADSPCIDAGNSRYAPSTDMDGDLRPAYDGDDIGADEFAPVIGDVDKDRKMDLSDLITILKICTENELTTAVYLEAEAVDDDLIDLKDALFILRDLATVQ